MARFRSFCFPKGNNATKMVLCPFFEQRKTSKWYYDEWYYFSNEFRNFIINTGSADSIIIDYILKNTSFYDIIK